MKRLTIVMATLMAMLLALSAVATASADDDDDAPVLHRLEITTDGGDDRQYTAHYNTKMYVVATFDRVVTVEETGVNMPIVWTDYNPGRNIDRVDMPILYEEGTGTNILTFAHTIYFDHWKYADAYHIKDGSFYVNYGGERHTINYSASNNADNEYLINEMPEVKYVRFASSPSNGSEYRTNEAVLVDVEFDMDVWVDDAGSKYAEGYPAVLLKMDNGDKRAHYISGNGTDTLRFSYTVRAPDQALKGLAIKKDAFGVYVDEDLDDDSFHYAFLPKKRKCDNHRVDYTVQVYER